MKPERWQQIELLYHSALEREPGNRSAFIIEGCHGDEELRREVVSLLGQQDSLLDHPAWEGTPALTASSCPVLSPGAQLGPYRIEALLGAGGMGEVFRATDTRLRRTVAIKILPHDQVADPERKRRFMQEARAVAALNHPHICQLYDVGPDYLVMEYIEGQPPRGPLPLDDAMRIAIQIAGALEEAHGRGILHRDLKPGNILISAKGGAKLLDFGLAKIKSSGGGEEIPQTVEGAVMGTSAYMSPEQAQAKPLDERSDIFSFGAVLYEMLSGKRAFGGGSTTEVLTAVIRDEPAPLTSPLAQVVTRCLAKPPAQRFQTMTEVRAALERISAKPTDRQPSIAVLPFVSADKEQEYFSDGLAEEIINLLAHIPGLKVIARTSAFAFRGKEQDIRTIAATLGVSTILEGSVRRAGNRIRVTAELISAEDGAHLFSDRYDREMADIFAMQDEIAAAIAAALRIKLSVQLAECRQYTPSLPAYEAILKARHYFYKLTPDSMARGREYLAQAIALDPGYAVPHSELGFHFILLAVLGMMPAREAMPMARVAAGKALEMNPSQPEAVSALGHIAAFYEYDWKEAGRLFGLAGAHGQILPVVCSRYARYLVALGRTREAIEECERALSNDPLNSYFRLNLALTLLEAGRPADAAKECRRVLELDEDYALAWFFLSMTSLQQGELEQALPAAERAVSLMPWYAFCPGISCGAARAHRRPGQGGTNAAETRRRERARRSRWVRQLLFGLRGNRPGRGLGCESYRGTLVVDRPHPAVPARGRSATQPALARTRENDESAGRVLSLSEVIDHAAGIVRGDPVDALAHLRLGRAFTLSGDMPKQRLPIKTSSLSGKMPIPTSRF